MQLEINNNTLYLPRLVDFKTGSPIPLTPISDELSTPLSEEEVAIWTTGPRNSSRQELGRCLILLGLCLGRLTQVCQGKSKVSSKSSVADLVTEADHGIEMLLRAWIKTFYPSHKIIGEEGEKEWISPHDFVWYIDPIDGTTNFVENSDIVAMHIGCTYNGSPYVCLLGLPIQDQYYLYDGTTTWNFSSQTPPQKMDIPAPIAKQIGTEYMNSQKKDHACFLDICEAQDMSAVRIRSIGANIAQLLTGNILAFYKPKAKLWDVIAPLGVVQGLFGDQITIQLYLESQSEPYSLFSNDPDVCTAINDCHFERGNDRIGLIIAYPTHQVELGQMIHQKVSSLSLF
jgi:myo-inositol-1(or 4)-monophosphatase